MVPDAPGTPGPRRSEDLGDKAWRLRSGFRGSDVRLCRHPAAVARGPAWWISRRSTMSGPPRSCSPTPGRAPPDRPAAPGQVDLPSLTRSRQASGGAVTPSSRAHPPLEFRCRRGTCRPDPSARTRKLRSLCLLQLKPACVSGGQRRGQASTRSQPRRRTAVRAPSMVLTAWVPRRTGPPRAVPCRVADRAVCHRTKTMPSRATGACGRPGAGLHHVRIIVFRGGRITVTLVGVETIQKDFRGSS